MKRLLACLLPLLGLVSAYAERYAPATVIVRPDNALQVFLASHDVDQITYAINDRGGQPQSLKMDQVVSVSYDKSISPDYLRALGFLNSGNFEGAAAFFEKAQDSAVYFWEREQSFLKRAEALRRQKRYEDAIGVLNAFLKKHPKSVLVLDAYGARGDLQLTAGDTRAAEASYEELAQFARKLPSRLSLRARTLAALGRADLAENRQDPAAAASILREVFRELDPQAMPDQYAEVGLSLADNLHAAKQSEAALTLLRQIGFQPLPADRQGAAHLARAKILEAAGMKMQAFDAAVFGLLRGSADPQVSGKARQLARQLATQLGKDDALSLEEQRTYRTYLEKL